jgi:hypothetical protein
VTDASHFSVCSFPRANAPELEANQVNEVESQLHERLSPLRASTCFRFHAV